MIYNKVYQTKISYMSTSKFYTKAKIIRIDDDRDINNLFKIYLEHNGYSVKFL